MNTPEFISLYQDDSLIALLASYIQQKEKNIQAKGLSGSSDAVTVAVLQQQFPQLTQLFVMHDREEAAYFQHDLQNLMPEKDILLFPTSYKKPYQHDETENANVLMRAEILNRINQVDDEGLLIVTYPEAFTEKVINRQSLVKNTFSITVEDELDTAFLTEFLVSYDFEKTDFVYEPGQFAVRGGIIDIYSYANDLPYRLELFGDEVESIRTFDPTSQLSEKPLNTINIIPNVQTRLLNEVRQPLLSYIAEDTLIWIKDFELTLNTIETAYQRAVAHFETILSKSAETTTVSSPDELYETPVSFSNSADAFTKIEFGNRFNLEQPKVVTFETNPQPSFNKNFDLLVEHLNENQLRGYSNIIAADSEKQINRLYTILEELDPTVSFQPLNVSLREGFSFDSLRMACFTDHQLFERFHRYKSKDRSTRSKAMTLKELNTLQPGDYITHVDYGIGRFAGLEKVEVGGREQESLRIVFRDDDLLYMSVQSLHKISKYSGKEGEPPVISKLGSQEWENKKKRTKKKVKDIAKDLINLYAKRKSTQGFPYKPDSYLQAELESSFLYEDTPDQARATQDVKEDMEQSHPMDRLVCGDVGFGKTEVAIRAAFKAITDGKQVAVLVPTTILAAQHYRTFTGRLSDFPVRIEYINRFKSTKQIKEILKAVTAGKVDILIGTHRIVNKDVQFKDLGLLIVDEEQKFGVKVKDKLKELRVNVDVLTLTATPIPRTLHFSLMGSRDLSVIATPPPNRQPVSTEIHTFNEEIIRDAVSYELQRGGQVFFVHNRINDIEAVGNIILRLVPEARIGIAHGQMEGPKLEKVMMQFIDGDKDVLVSTNIIESGLDIPNANTIMINNAHMFGLSDLHQMRGRVGRSNRKAFCYLLSPPVTGLTSEARKRLSTLEDFSDLGDGFKVAMRDLDIRGAGNLLGAEQSGFINDLGFEMYHKILDEAVQELKETEFRDLFEHELADTTRLLVTDCNIETDLEMLIPDWYVSNTSERLSLYSKLDNLKTEEQLSEFSDMLRDRFGPIPDSVQDLIETVRLRWKAVEMGFEKLTIKDNKLKGYIPTANNDNYFQSDAFGAVLSFVQNNSARSQLKDTKKRLILVVNQVAGIADAKAVLDQVLHSQPA